MLIQINVPKFIVSVNFICACTVECTVLVQLCSGGVFMNIIYMKVEETESDILR